MADALLWCFPLPPFSLFLVAEIQLLQRMDELKAASSSRPLQSRDRGFAIGD
jgi:hypothetical protein